MEVLGRGMFSKVVRRDDNFVEKIIDIDLQRPPHNWHAELAALQQISHPNIVKLVKYEEKKKYGDSECHFTFPRLDFTLENVIYNNAKANYPANSGSRNVMPIARVREIILGISDALAYLDTLGIIHRDLKPENIMFAFLDGIPQLIDFGVAFVPEITTTWESKACKVCEICTGLYKAPELLYGFRNYDSKIDVWSLGCILVRLLNHDCKPLFDPYTSDIALIVAQFEILGRPSLEECPTLRNTALANMTPLVNQEKRTSSLKLTRNQSDKDANTLWNLAMSILNYEPSLRPTAAEISQQLKTGGFESQIKCG